MCFTKYGSKNDDGFDRLTNRDEKWLILKVYSLKFMEV